MTALVVREFRAEEWRLFRELRLRALADSPDAFAETVAEAEARSDAEWRELLRGVCASPAHVLFVAERAAHAIGMVFGRLDAAAPALAHLGAMWVDPAERRFGAGRALVGAVTSWASERGARAVELRVAEGNAPAELLYANAGFARSDERAPLRAGSELRVRTMRLELDIAR